MGFLKPFHEIKLVIFVLVFLTKVYRLPVFISYANNKQYVPYLAFSLSTSFIFPACVFTGAYTF